MQTQSANSCITLVHFKSMFIDVLTHSQVAIPIQKEHPIFCSAVFSVCLLYSPPEPCSHFASISLIQSFGIPLLFMSISFSFQYSSPSWVPRCSHWCTTSVSATINTGRWLSISVSEWNHDSYHCMQLTQPLTQCTIRNIRQVNRGGWSLCRRWNRVRWSLDRLIMLNCMCNNKNNEETMFFIYETLGASLSWYYCDNSLCNSFCQQFQWLGSDASTL